MSPERSGCAGFDAALRSSGLGHLSRGGVTTLQINVGKLCNQACHHCHVEAGPKRTEVMQAAVARRVLCVLERSAGIRTVDITGGAPELNPNFRTLVNAARRFGCKVIDRCNLTVLFEAGMEWLPEFLAAEAVHIVASLPCYSRENVEKQRGHGVFDKSVEALRRLNTLGYGSSGSTLHLDLVYNPVGAILPPPQAVLETDYKRRLADDYGIEFNRLLTITNMPIGRFAMQLERTGQYQSYMELLINHFNPATVDGLMCRQLLSVGFDGRLYDCDFNQMLELGIGAEGAAEAAATIWDIENFADLAEAAIRTGGHCFGCTAGAGSSCSGALR